MIIIIRGSIYSILSRTTSTSSSIHRIHRLQQQHTSSKSSSNTSNIRWRHSSLTLNNKNTIESMHNSMKKFKWHQKQTFSDNNINRIRSSNQRYSIRQKCLKTILLSRRSQKEVLQEVVAVLITGDWVVPLAKAKVWELMVATKIITFIRIRVVDKLVAPDPA